MIRQALALLLTASAAVPVAVSAQTADTVLINGKIYTANAKDEVVPAVAILNDRFVAVGTNKAVESHVGPSTKLIDLKGRFVSPGLTDAHFHSEGGGPGVDLSKTRSMAELLDKVAAAVAAAPPGGLIFTNWDWHEAQLKEKRLPTTVDLDAISPNNPVVLVRGGHSLILNSVALAKYGINRDTVVPAGGAIPRDAKGNLTGEVIDAAKKFVALPPPPAVTEADLLKTQSTLNRYGITAVRIPGGYKGDLLAAYGLMKKAEDEGRLTLRYNVYLPGFALQSGDEARKLIAKWNVKQDEGDDWVRIGGIKLAIDGGFEGAHTIEPYAEPYGQGGTFHGLMTVTPDRLNDVVMTLDNMGWRPTVHAAGDAAIAEVLDSYERADAVKPIAGKRWAIEHAHISNAGLVERMKKLDVMLSVQDHLYLAAPALKRYWGEARATQVTPLKTYLEAGLVVAGGTDAPVIPFNPFWELYHFASRDTMSDGVYGANERVLSRQQLLRLVTINFAKLIGEEQIKGSIETGKLADFAVLSEDFLTTDVTRIPDMHALATFVGGKQVYTDPTFK